MATVVAAAEQDLVEDAPPPLSCLADQMHAVQLANSIIGTAGLQVGELRPAAVVDAVSKQEVSCSGRQQEPAAVGAKQALKRGFLDAKPRKVQDKRSGQQGVPLLKAQQQQQQPGIKPIPDFMRLPPDEQQQRVAAMKSQLLTALQPTPDTVAAVAQDSTLMSGFDDPEVMAAVSEVARDPKALSKYANNPKVRRFYAAMGSFMGAKLEGLGQSC